MKRLFCLVFLLSTLASQAQKLEGEVIDVDTREKLPFVSILYNAKQSLGVSTDADGKFLIEDRSLIVKLEITFIGYRSITLTPDQLPRSGPLLIEMKSLNTELEEAVVNPGENPALRIIRNAIRNSDNNDPKKYGTYRYKGYNKNILTRSLDSTVSARKQLGLMIADSANELLPRYLMISETVSKIRSKKPDHYKEEIVGTKISGFKNSIYAVGAENIQYFGLYDDVVQVLTEYYITPLAKGADKKYFYILQDTIIKGTDSTYIMYYQPKIGSNFEGLTGEIHINTNGWAMEYIFAEPYYKGLIDFAMRHSYQYADDKGWFPENLSILLFLEQLPMYRDPGFVYSELFVDSVELNVPISDDEFDHVKRELTEDAPYVNDDFWEKYRPEGGLNTKEIRTYTHMDSIGDRYKFDFFMNAARNIYHGYFTIDPVELRVNKFLRYTGYEGIRVGAGVYTSPKFSKRIRFGGYYGYGTQDFDWKYGGTLEYFFNRKNDHKLTLDYSSDVMQPGVVNLRYFHNTNFWAKVWADHMDRIDELSLMYKTRLSTFMTLETKLRKYDIYSNNSYQFFDPAKPDARAKDRFSFAELNLQWRWAYKERITSNFGNQISAGTNYPVVMVNYGKGFDGILGGQYNYNRIEVGTWLYRYIKGWGFLDARIEAGYVDQALPYQLLFSNRSSYSPSLSFVGKNTFQTMRFNEFFADRYVSFFLNHNFGSLLFRTQWFQPEISVFHAMSVGTLSNPEFHNNLEFKTLEDGFYESGVVISNILHIQFFKVGYVGFGGGVFYRYGPNQMPNEYQNWAAKFSIIYTIN